MIGEYERAFYAAGQLPAQTNEQHESPCSEAHAVTRMPRPGP